MHKVFALWRAVLCKNDGHLLSATFPHIPDPDCAPIILPAGFKKISRLKWLRCKTNMVHNGVVEQPQAFWVALRVAVQRQRLARIFQGVHRSNLWSYGNTWKCID